MSSLEEAKDFFTFYYSIITGLKQDYILNNFNTILVNKKDTNIITAKNCAYFSVSEILKSSPTLPILSDSGNYSTDIEENKIYWDNVKREIENL